MIKELHLENWKSHKASTVYIDPLTVLIGANASGKSNILDALFFLRQISLGRQVTSAVIGDQDYTGVRGGMDWLIRRGADNARIQVVLESETSRNEEYSYEIAIHTPDAKRAEVLSESLTVHDRRQSPPEKKIFYTSDDTNMPSIKCFFPTGKRGRPKRVDLRRTYSILSQCPSADLGKDAKMAITDVLDQLGRIFMLEPIPSHMRSYTALSERLQTDGANVAGVLAALEEERKKEVEHEISDYLRKLPEKDIGRVWTETIGRFKSDAMLYCEEGWNPDEEPFIIDARGMSDGTLRFIAIITAMMTMSAGSLLVIEEIDNGLHPWRARLLVEFLKKMGAERKVDVLCTTHNPALMDALGPEMIPYISLIYRDKQSGDSAVKLVEDIETLPRLLAQGSIGKLATSGALNQAIN